jgi:hypothetical protein
MQIRFPDIYAFPDAGTCVKRQLESADIAVEKSGESLAVNDSESTCLATFTI